MSGTLVSLFPQQLNMSMIDPNVDEIDVRGDGWCLYASYLYAFRIYRSSIGLHDKPSPAECWRMACTVSTILDGIIKTDSEEGVALRESIQAILDAEVMKNVKGERITTPEQYLLQLRTLQQEGDPSKGPLLWPDISIIGTGFTKAVPTVGWVLYQSDKIMEKDNKGITIQTNTGKYNLNTAIFSDKNKDQSPSTDLTKPYILLLHTGADHYQLLRPKEGKEIWKQCLPAGTSLTWKDEWYRCDANGNPLGAPVPVPVVAPNTTASPIPTIVPNHAATPVSTVVSAVASAVPPVPSTIPGWASTFLKPANVDPKCAPHGIFQTPDCVTRNLADHLATVDKFAQSYRVSKQTAESDPMRAAYAADYAAWMAEPDPQKKTSLKKKMDAKYYDVDVLVHAANGSTRPYKVVNPYRAMASREAAGVSFANPGGKFPAGTDEAILQLNSDVLQAIAPPELIANTPYAISLLESLWFCGMNPSLSTDPRCYPAQVLGELREYTTYKNQVRDSTAAGKLLAADSDGIVRKFVDFLKGKGVTRMAEAPAAPVPSPVPSPVSTSPSLQPSPTDNTLSPLPKIILPVPSTKREEGKEENTANEDEGGEGGVAGRSLSGTPKGVSTIIPMVLGKPKEIRDAFVIPTPLAGGRRRVFAIKPRNK